MSNYPAGVTDDDEAFDLPSVDGHDDDGEDEPTTIPCSRCGRPTSWDAQFQDLCYKCVRCAND